MQHCGIPCGGGTIIDVHSLQLRAFTRFGCRRIRQPFFSPAKEVPVGGCGNQEELFHSIRVVVPAAGASLELQPARDPVWITGIDRSWGESIIKDVMRDRFQEPQDQPRRPRATLYEIQKWVDAKHGFLPKAAWIE